VRLLVAGVLLFGVVACGDDGPERWQVSVTVPGGPTACSDVGGVNYLESVQGDAEDEFTVTVDSESSASKVVACVADLGGTATASGRYACVLGASSHDQRVEVGHDGYVVLVDQ
jgi:hypothetical protein